ncbi:MULTISPECIES: DUF1289 domain-containing protein [Leisingera]|uniref:DUF1289 domain-containing protein n=1 Tax=Leisingera TaxID=191028 RepID=UPI0004008C5F|nr:MULTISPECIES: DUF1289 domain-containing protein [Leisingera]UWQ85930.1 DUF1289 domain-containing protein [Leisingera caerulea]
MCKNADNPCPGCKKHKKAEAAWMFFTDEERAAIESMRQAGKASASRKARS